VYSFLGEEAVAPVPNAAPHKEENHAPAKPSSSYALFIKDAYELASDSHTRPEQLPELRVAPVASSSSSNSNLEMFSSQIYDDFGSAVRPAKANTNKVPDEPHSAPKQSAAPFTPFLKEIYEYSGSNEYAALLPEATPFAFERPRSDKSSVERFSEQIYADFEGEAIRPAKLESKAEAEATDHLKPVAAAFTPFLREVYESYGSSEHAAILPESVPVVEKKVAVVSTSDIFRDVYLEFKAEGAIAPATFSTSELKEAEPVQPATISTLPVATKIDPPKESVTSHKGKAVAAPPPVSPTPMPTTSSTRNTNTKRASSAPAPSPFVLGGLAVLSVVSAVAFYFAVMRQRR